MVDLGGGNWEALLNLTFMLSFLSIDCQTSPICGSNCNTVVEHVLHDKEIMGLTAAGFFSLFSFLLATLPCGIT